METTLYAAIKQVRDALHAGGQPGLEIQWAAKRYHVDPVEIAVHVIEAQHATSAALALRLEELQEAAETQSRRSRKKDVSRAA